MIAAFEARSSSCRSSQPRSAWEADSRPGAAPPTAGPVDALPTVLIADDDLGILLLLQTTLRNEGLRLLTASDGESALRIARQERPDLILMDWHMPGA